jgi:hypothetical protein
MALTTIFTHENYIAAVSTANWQAILQGLASNLASYNPSYVTLDYACQYVRATRTSRLVASTCDSASGQVTAAFTGKTDMNTVVYIFVGADNSISSSFGTVPAFSGNYTNTVAALAMPLSLSLVSLAVVAPPHFLTPLVQWRQLLADPGWRKRADLPH